MKHILISLLLVISTFSILHSQNASTYFPSSTGYRWYYKNTPLDSLNNPVPSLARYRVDSFAVIQNYNGLQSSIVRLKDNLLTINQNTAYNDTSYHNFQTTNGWEYMNMSIISDTLGLPIGVLNFFRGMQGWYSVYQFASTVGTSYSILTKDTTISINSTNVHLRFKATAKRLADETISTVNGTYTAKKFIVSLGLYVVVVIIELPIAVMPDTTWIAPSVWMVKDVTPSISIDLSTFGYGTIPITGRIYELAQLTGINNISSEIPDKYSLYQNYPNPFNPTTNIKYQIRNNSFVTLKIYDNLGKEIYTLVNEKLNAGTYESKFDASGLSSGVYFYKLTSGDFSETKKMLLIK
jgi:hypothetical protein